MDMEEIKSADIITGGFPCQDISYAGKGAGLAGERSGLWWQLRRTIRMVRPRFALLENVAALLNREMGTVLGSLAQIGYDAEWHCIPASSIGAPHDRDRAWIIAHPNTQKNSLCTVREILKNHIVSRTNCSEPWGETFPPISRMGDGIPGELDRLGACGNAVVPEIPYIIGQAILEASK